MHAIFIFFVREATKRPTSACNVRPMCAPMADYEKARWMGTTKMDVPVLVFCSKRFHTKRAVAPLCNTTAQVLFSYWEAWIAKDAYSLMACALSIPYFTCSDRCALLMARSHPPKDAQHMVVERQLTLIESSADQRNSEP